MSFKFFRSPRLIQILKELKSGPKSKNELKNCLKVSTSRITQILSMAKSMGLVDVSLDMYIITSKGLLVLNAYEILENFDNICKTNSLNDYYLDDIPSYLLDRIYQLSNIKILDECDIFYTNKNFSKILIESYSVKCYTNVFCSEYIDLFSNLVESGKDVNIIVSKNVLKEILLNHKKELKDILKKSNIRFYISNKDYKISLLILDTKLIISFYLKNKIFNYKKIFICNDEDCLDWGEELYSYILKNSKEYNF